MPGREGNGVVVLAAVERFALRIHAGKGIHGFDSIVPVDTTLGSGGAHQPIALVESLVAKERADVPTVDILHSAGQELRHFVVALLHAEQHGGLMLRWKILELEGLARPDA